jgi:hypothetical protein
MKKTLFRGAVTAALLLSVGAQQSWAWGREGHRLTALVAENYLTPETRAAVKELLGKQTIADVASWADEYRAAHPETGKWHYADTPLAEAAYNRDRDCPVSSDPKSPWRDCVVDRVLYFEMRLADKTLSHEERAEALKYVIHFIGDIHQPLHVVGDARGGNDITITFLGSTQCGSFKCNLHGTWDDAMIEHHDMNEKKYTAFLLSDIEEHNWQKLANGNPVQWANASHKYAMNAFAPNGALITKEYYAEEIKVIDSQLALGGLRLARVLNTVLSGQPVPPMPVDANAPARTPMPKP